METITLEDGTTREVPTVEEMEEQKLAVEKAKQLEDDLAKLKKEKEKMDDDPAMKNFKLLREKNERLIKLLKEQGKDLDEEGNIIDKPSSLTVEEITKMTQEAASKAALQATLSQQKNTLLSKYANDEDTKKVVEHYYDKLTAGEEVSLENITKFFTEAETLANPGAKVNNDVISINGAPPRSSIDNNGKQSFAETDVGKALADEVFGDNSFTKEQK